MRIPKITQNNVRTLLPAKIAQLADIIYKREGIPQQEALLFFYKSKTYASLEREETKYWWMSPLQLYQTYCLEKEEIATSETAENKTP